MPEKLTRERKVETLAILEHTSADTAAFITEYGVDRTRSSQFCGPYRDSA